MSIFKSVPAEWQFNPENLEKFSPVKRSIPINITNPVVEVPVFDGGLVYTGEILAPTFTGYNSRKMTMSGDLEATDAGTYTVNFTPVEGFRWSDGSTDPVAIQWTIGAAEPIVTPDTEYHIEFNQLLSSLNITGTATFNDVDVPGTFSWVTSDEEFLNMQDPAVVTWKFVPDSANFVTVTGTISIDIDEIDIDNLPTPVAALSYTGEEQTPEWDNYDPEMLTISGDVSGTEVGIYAVTFTPTEKYEWSDGTRDPRTVQWSIERAVIDLPTVSEEVAYSGSEVAPVITGYDSTKMSMLGTPSATDVGTYQIEFILNSSYCWPDKTTDPVIFSWSIVRLTINVPTVSGSLTYTGGTLTPTFNGYDSTKMTASGAMSGVNVGTYTVAFTPIAGYMWPDGTSGAKNVTWSIVKQSVTVPTASTSALTYNGSVQTKSFNNFNSGLMTVSGNTATNAGTHTATFSLRDTNNYQWRDGTITDKNVTWTINKASVTVPTASGSLTYNGASQTMSFNNYNSSLMTVSGNTGTNADNYTATFALKDTTNYQWANGTTTNKTVSWSIAKKTVTKPTVSSTSSFTYDGTTKSVYTGSNSDIVVSGTASAVNAGSYSLTLSLPSTTNYVWSDGTTAAISKSWTINKATISGFSITPNVTSLEGAGTVTFTLKGVPSGVTASVVCNNTSYNPTGSGNTRSVALPNADGTYKFTATITNSNYNTATATCTVTVTKAIELPNVDGGTYVSNGYWETGIQVSVSGSNLTLNANSFPNLVEACPFEDGSDSLSICTDMTWYADGSSTQNNPYDGDTVVNIRIPTAIVNQIDERMQYAMDNGHHDFEPYIQFPDNTGITYHYDLWNYKKANSYSGGYLVLNKDDGWIVL